MTYIKNSFFLFGPRGVGKSALIKLWLQGNTHSLLIDLLHEKQFLSYLQTPSRLREEVIAAMERSKRYLTVVVDEIQRLPRLLNEVHSLLETYPERIRFILTGSSARKLKREGANLLAGRAFVEHLYPFTNREISLPLTSLLQTGTLPKVINHPKTSLKFLRTYVETYLKEEIKQEALVRNLDVFVRFLDLAAQLNAEPTNYSKLAKSIGSTHVTVENYFSILEDTLIVTRINGWSHSVKKQLLQSPRYYFFDCGVLNALRGELQVMLKPTSYRYGKLFETWILNEIVHINRYKDFDLKLNYWRTETGREVDIILSRGYGKPIAAIEIKSSQNPLEEDLKGLLSFEEDYPGTPLYCFCDADRPQKKGKILCVPWQEGINKIIPRLAKS